MLYRCPVRISLEIERMQIGKPKSRTLNKTIIIILIKGIYYYVSKSHSFSRNIALVEI